MNKKLKDDLIEIGWTKEAATRIGNAYEAGDMEAMFDALEGVDVAEAVKDIQFWRGSK